MQTHYNISPTQTVGPEYLVGANVPDNYANPSQKKSVGLEYLVGANVTDLG